VRLLGAEVGGELSCRAGAFKNSENTALFADGAKITGDIFLDEGFSAKGAVRLLGAQVGGALYCGGGTFKNPGRDALFADGAKITGGVFLNEGFSAKGGVHFLGAEIGGQLSCRGGIFKNAGGAFFADRAKITGGVFLNEGFSAKGTVRLLGAQVGGVLSCRGGIFKNRGGDALSADGAKITGGVLLDQGFSAKGAVRLLETQVGGQLSCRGGTFKNRRGHALSAEGMTVMRVFIWQPKERAEGVTNFQDAHVGHYIDAKSTWPTGRDLMLNGFAYDAINSQPEDATPAERIAWIGKNDRYSPQPYQQLAAIYRRHGHDEAARQIAIARQRARRKEGALPWWSKAWSRLLGATVGYGYRPWLAAFWVVGLWVAGVALFTWGPTHSDIMLGLKTGCTPKGPCKVPTSAVREPRFNLPTYILDSLLPIVNLRQRDFWIPNASHPWGWLYLDFVLFAAVAGWALATAVVAALTGLIRKD
jgi:hypothetical protein